ncbi:MAG: hypothetical protein M3088_00925 [Actinomycetota bacterium]|nr:hypothetical protein [Actinomycetota bacterium]
MGRVWVLDTGTKGTGAEMVPLEKVLRDPDSAPGRRFVAPKPELPPQPEEAPQPRRPPRFKVVDVMSRRVLAEGASTRATVEALEKARSVVDVTVYRWDFEAEDWRMLSHRERRLLWELRGR